MSDRRSLIAQAHIAATQLGIDDDARRAIQKQYGGHESCAKMTAYGLRRLLNHYRALGWKPRPPKRSRAKKLASAPQHKKIRALWLALADAGVVRDRGEPALRSYVRRQTGVSALQWLDPMEASRVIEALKLWCDRADVEIDL